jgi:hypothetical protein
VLYNPWVMGKVSVVQPMGHGSDTIVQPWVMGSDTVVQPMGHGKECCTTHVQPMGTTHGMGSVVVLYNPWVMGSDIIVQPMVMESDTTVQPMGHGK